MNVNEYSGKTLAFLGDAVWSLVVRHALLKEGENNSQHLQKDAIAYVSNNAQATFYTKLHEQGFFSEEEEAQYHRGRNSSSSSIPHSTDAQTYRISTGFEAMLGALYLENKQERIQEIWDKVRTL